MHSLPFFKPNFVLKILQLIFYIYMYAFSRRFYTQSNLQYIQVIHFFITIFFVSMCVPWELNLCAANALLYHWATATFKTHYTLYTGNGRSTWVHCIVDIHSSCVNIINKGLYNVWYSYYLIYSYF